MEISFVDMQRIRTQMGEHYDSITVIDGVLHLYWWASKHRQHIEVDGYSGHISYVMDFYDRVSQLTKDFDRNNKNKIEGKS